MEEKNSTPDLLDMMVQPGFYAENHIIVRLNAAAEGLLLSPGMDVHTLIASGLAEYQSFDSGCLYLRLRLSQSTVGASVIKKDGMDVFLLDTQESDSALRALSLAARELREPLASIMVSAGGLNGEEGQLALLNRSIFPLCVRFASIIPPAGANFRALEMRFRIARSSCSRSAMHRTCFSSPW